MGTLIARKYPTILALGAADHTYVECGTGGKAWSCWGGKTGGMAFNRGTGSTSRADAIAQPNERAAITCYLVNGVCHQAANRILFPAGIVVSGARGYTLSVSIFGIYGRRGVGSCSTAIPFNNHPGVSGDLAACLGPPRRGPSSPTKAAAPSVRETAHLKSIQGMYRGFAAESATALDEMNLHVRMFEREVDFRFNGKLPRLKAQGLREAKVQVELAHHQMTERLGRGELEAASFVIAFNAMTERFQNDAANALTGAQFKQMFNYERDERLVLADPEAVDASFGQGTAKRVYGDRLPR
jgi:hypothetical protein